MSDKIEKSEELRNKINESLKRIEEVSFIKKIKNGIKDIVSSFDSHEKIVFDKLKNKDSAATKKYLDFNRGGMDDKTIKVVEKVIKLKQQEEKVNKAEKQSRGDTSKSNKSSVMVYLGGDSWKLNGNHIENLIIYKPGVNPKETLENYDWSNGAMSWLAKAKFSAKYLSIDLSQEMVDVFVGEWNGGAFRGNIFTDYGIGRIQAKEGDSKFRAGIFSGKTLRINYTNWMTSPYNFAGRKIDHTEEGILGLPNTTSTQEVDHNGIHLIQVPNGYTIEFKTEDDEFINAVRVVKRMDARNTDFVFSDVNTGNQVTVLWDDMRKSFNKFYLKPGKVFNIPGLFETREPIGTIEIKKSSAVSRKSIGQAYQKQKGGGLTKIKFGSKFPVLGKVGLKGEFNILNFNKILSKDPEALHFIKMFQKDLEGGGGIFTSHMNKVKDAIVNRDKYKREVGYGKYPYLKRLTDKQGSKITDPDLDKSLKFISDFIENIVGNVGKVSRKTGNFAKDDKSQGVLLNAMKKALHITKEKETKASATSKSAPKRNTVSNIMKNLEESDVRRSVRKIIQEEDDETFFGK